MPRQNDHSEVHGNDAGYQPKFNEISKNFVEDLLNERSRLSENFPLCALLIDEAFDRVYSTGRIPGREFYADVLKQKPMKITQKVFVPVKQYPKFNFSGKILGPKGNSLIRLQDETQCKITIKGRNSMRDKVREEELRNSDDPRYNHLNKDLYLEISTVATPAECYARIAYALAEIRKYLIPDKNDEVSHEQLREIMEIDPEMAKAGYSGNPKIYKSVLGKTASEGTARYLNMLKQSSYPDRPQLESKYEPINHVPQKQPTSSSYARMKVSLKSNGYKRTAAPVYTVPKRIHEVSPSKPYNTNIKTSHPYGILKKHK